MVKILLIDDEEFTSGLIKSYLEKRGYEVVMAHTGADGLSAYPKENPDLVLLDLGLPDMNGRDILKDIKDKMSKIKVVVISAYKEQHIRDDIAKLGADYYLVKPFTTQKLYETVQGILKEGAA